MFLASTVMYYYNSEVNMKNNKKAVNSEKEKTAMDYINELTDRAMDFTSRKIEDIERKVNDIVLSDKK